MLIKFAEILLSWFFEYELIMKNNYSNPLLVNIYLSDLVDEKCFVCKSSSLLCLGLIIRCTVISLLYCHTTY